MDEYYRYEFKNFEVKKLPSNVYLVDYEVSATLVTNIYKGNDPGQKETYLMSGKKQVLFYSLQDMIDLINKIQLDRVELSEEKISLTNFLREGIISGLIM